MPKQPPANQPWFKRLWRIGFVVTVLTTALILAGTLLPAAAQSPGPRVFLPLLSVPQTGTVSTEPVYYDLVADAKSDSAWAKVTSAYSANDLTASRDGTAVEIQDEDSGDVRTLVDIYCEGQQCTRGKKPKTDKILVPEENVAAQDSPAALDSIEAFEVIVAVDAATTLHLLLENRRNLTIDIIKNGDLVQTTVFTCKTGTCTIQLGADEWTTPTPEPTATPTTVVSEPTATPTPTFTPTSETGGQTGDGPIIESFVLVNADTDQDIRPLSDGDTINLASDPNMTVRVQTQPAEVGSVQFTLDGSSTYADGTPRRENAAPYSLNGDNNGDFNAWQPSLGQHTIEAVAYSASNGNGTAGTPKTLTLNIVQDDQTPPTATATSTTQPTTDPTAEPTATPTAEPTAAPGEEPAIVFVSRQIPNGGSIYWDAPKDMPGVGPHSRFRVAAPGKLLVRESNGQLRTLVDGANPTVASLNLIDVNAPDVSYDGNTIVFAGLPEGNYSTGPVTNPDAWRIYAINADGSNLRQITFSDQQISYSQFGSAAGNLQGYDDTDPAWLPDGRIVFASTRWPSFAQYSGVRTSNLYVIDADGGNLHRITSERNGADRPVIDPITGKIVYARWWRNHRFATDSMDTITANGGYAQKDGLTTDRSNHVGGSDFLWRNQWHPAAINPDGTELVQWGGTHHKLDSSHVYGGAFTADGRFVANYFPMANMTEAGGFGGLRLYDRGPGNYQSILGITSLTLDYVSPSNPTSYGIFNGNYATEAAVMPDGRLVLSWAEDINQDYGLYFANLNGSGLTLLYDNPGTTELRAKPLVARPLPPIIPDQITQVASLLPPTAAGPYDQDGTFTFNALNVYANGPVDGGEVNAPAVGSAATIRFFTDFQRTSPGSFPNQDWPILLDELIIAPDGSVSNSAAPANVPLFEQLRSPDGLVPRSTSPGGVPGGAAHVAGMNFGHPGENQRCVGCHVGHTMIEVPADDADAKWSNLAPGAQVRVSSARDANQNRGLIDRRVMKGEIWRYWTSSAGQTQNQWVELVFPVPVTVRTVRLYNPRSGGEANSSVQVQSTTVRLYSDANATNQVASASSGALSVQGTDVGFADVQARVVRVEITGVSGTFYGAQVASLAEVEVIARGEAP